MSGKNDDKSPQGPRGTDVSSKSHDSEAPQKRFNDFKKGMLPFLIVNAAYLGLAVYSIGIDVVDWKDVTDITATTSTATNSTGDFDDVDSTTVRTNTRLMFVAASALGFALTFALMAFIRYFPYMTIWLGPTVCVLLILGELAVSVYVKDWVMTVVLLLAFIFFAALCYFMRGRIKLSGELLKTANIAADGHRPDSYSSMFHIKRAYLVVIFGLFAQLALSILNVSVLIAVVFRFQPNHAGCDTEGGCGWGTTFTLCAIVILIHLWQASVLTNVVLVINAGGTFSPWYFDNGNLGTRQSLKLAMTRSLGSIAWGSLLVGIIELIHKFFHMMEQALSSNPCTACCCKILSCFTMILKKLIEKFNRYVYIFIAVGRPSLDPPVESFSDDFRAAARHTLQFFGRRGKHDTAIARSQGLASLVDDSIVDLSLTAAAFVTGMLCVGFTYLYMYVVDDKAVSNHSYNWGILIYAFISSHSICLLLTSALDAGVSTIFVCISEDESRLEDKAPDLYQLIVGNARYQAIFPGVARSQPVRKEGSIGQMTDIAKRLV